MFSFVRLVMIMVLHSNKTLIIAGGFMHTIGGGGVQQSYTHIPLLCTFIIFNNDRHDQNILASAIVL